VADAATGSNVVDVKLVLAVSLAGAGSLFGLICDVLGLRKIEKQAD